VQVSAGARHSLGISDDGSVWSWGSNESGQLGVDDDSLFQSFLPIPVHASNGKPQTYKQISASGDSSMGISADIFNDGKVWGWGSNFGGQLGDGTSGVDNNSILPTAVDVDNGRPQKYKQISLGGLHTLGISNELNNDNKTWSWGTNTIGQLGINNETNQFFPTSIPFVHKIYNGYLHGEVGRTKYLRQFGTEPLDHGVKFVTTTEFSLQAWLPSGNGSNQLILWRRSDNNNDGEIEDNGDDDEAL
jgi:alpha-tubulin suppressor-like RCC1 family protein